MTERRLNPEPTAPATGGAFATRGLEANPVDTNAEESYWRENYAARPYVTEGTSFSEYKPAYRYGADAHARHPGRSFDEAEADLGNDWDRFKGTSSLTWQQARHAARDAWQRVKDFVERAMPGDYDRDGK